MFSCHLTMAFSFRQLNRWKVRAYFDGLTGHGVTLSWWGISVSLVCLKGVFDGDVTRVVWTHEIVSPPSEFFHNSQPDKNWWVEDKPFLLGSPLYSNFGSVWCCLFFNVGWKRGYWKAGPDFCTGWTFFHEKWTNTWVALGFTVYTYFRDSSTQLLLKMFIRII